MVADNIFKEAHSILDLILQHLFIGFVFVGCSKQISLEFKSGRMDFTTHEQEQQVNVLCIYIYTYIYM